MLDGLEGTAGPFAGKDSGQASPMSDRKKNRRKKSMNQKGDAAVGQAEGNAAFYWEIIQIFWECCALLLSAETCFTSNILFLELELLSDSSV